MKYEKPDIYSEADWEMVQGYMHGKDGLWAKSSNVAYMHGYRNGLSDLTGEPHEKADVLRRRAMMIPGITPIKDFIQGDLK